MIICVDVGNTKVTIGVMEKYQKLYGFSFPTIKDAKKDYFIRELKSNLKDKCDAIICSVCPEINDELCNAFSYLGMNAKLVNPLALEHMLGIGLSKKEELGADIFVGSLASIDEADDSSIVIDMGTATTLVLTYKRTLMGGAIYPGVKTSYQNLFSKASLLREVEFDIPKKVVGDDTVSCIHSGMMYGTIGAIKEIITEIKKEYKVKRIIFTGGMGKFFASFFKGATYDEDLILKGLVKIDDYLRGNR